MFSVIRHLNEFSVLQVSSMWIISCWLCVMYFLPSNKTAKSWKKALSCISEYWYFLAVRNHTFMKVEALPHAKSHYKLLQYIFVAFFFFFLRKLLPEGRPHRGRISGFWFSLLDHNAMSKFWWWMKRSTSIVLIKLV